MAHNLGDNNPDGCTFGNSTDEKISFYGVTPIVQPAATDQAAMTNSSTVTPNNTFSTVANTTTLTHAVGTADATVADVTGAFDQTILNNNFKEITTVLAQQNALNLVLATALSTVVNKVITLRSALVSLGAIKGSA